MPENEFEKCLNRNVIDRYSNGKSYSTITFISYSRNQINLNDRNKQKAKELLYIKSPFFNTPCFSNIEQYLGKLKEIVHGELPLINRGGFLAIQTQDVRIGGYVEPLAKRVIDTLTIDNLCLKEIVIVTQEGVNLNAQKSDYLEIVHQYLLVYEVKK